MAQDLIIRPLHSNDATQWRDVWRQYLEYYETSVSDEVYASTFARLLGDDPQDFTCLIAELNDVPIGLTHFLFHRHAWKIENVCYLQDLFVSPQVRGTGAGRALIEAVYRAADENNAPAVYWLTQDFNTNARRLYDNVAALTPFIKYTRP